MPGSLKCPQCGEKLITNLDNLSHCPLCGWGGNGVQVPTGRPKVIDSLSGKSLRWKTAALSSVIIIALIVPQGVSYAISEISTNRAISKAKDQMNQRLYASAAKTLHQTPAKSLRSDKVKEIRVLLADNVRFARDISGVGSAKEAIVQSNPAEALDAMEDVDEDFPHDDEVVELIDLAQDQTLNPDIEVTEEQVDEIAYVPDDPEEEIVDELDSDNDGSLDEIPVTDEDRPSTTPATSTPGAQSGGSSTGSISNDNQTTMEEPEPDDGDPVDPEELLDPPEDELPDAPEGDLPLESQGAPPALGPQQSRLVDFHVLKWQDNPNSLSNQDHFFTVDVVNEVNTLRDRKSGFGGYSYGGVVAGKLYKRKVQNSRRIIPLYRYWSANRVDHYYTTNRNFSSGNPNANYVRQGVAGYIGKWSERQNRCLAGNKPFYNVYHPRLTDNFYTTDVVHKNLLVSQGWTNPRIVGCIW